jgi:hypothetical protein
LDRKTRSENIGKHIRGITKIHNGYRDVVGFWCWCGDGEVVVAFQAEVYDDILCVSLFVVGKGKEEKSEEKSEEKRKGKERVGVVTDR